jgi:protein-tyrosine phosphatase
MKDPVPVIIVLLAITGCAVAQKGGSEGEHRHPAPGTSIRHFAQIDDGVYKGSKPKNDADYRFLQSKKIKYIVDLKFFPLVYRIEKRKARKYGMAVIPVTINASPIAPSEKHVRKILCLLSDKRLRPIYFHCSVGRDRTSLIAALYEVYFQGLPREKAWHEMRDEFGFKDDWTLRGLRAYLQQHLESPFAGGRQVCEQ